MGSSHSPDLAQGSHTTLTTLNESLNEPRRDALAFLRVSHWVPLGVPLGVMRDGWGLYPVTVALQSRPLIQSHTPHPLTVALQSLPPLTPLTSFPLTLFTTHNPL